MDILLLCAVFFITLIFLLIFTRPRKSSGKTYIDKNGYYRFTNSDRLVHRWLAEKTLGRKLRKAEVVHHKDRNKLNNSPENLQVFPNQAKHDKEHKRSGWYTNKRKRNKSKLK